MKMKRALSWVLLVAMLVSMFGTGVVATDTVEAPQETPAVVEPIAEPVVSPEPQSEPAPVVEETPAETSEDTELLTTPAETPEETPEATQTPEETPAEAPAAPETPTETGEETTEEQPAAEEPATEEPAAEENATETVELLPEESTEEDAEQMLARNIYQHNFNHLDIRIEENTYTFSKYYIDENGNKVDAGTETMRAYVTKVYSGTINGVTYTGTGERNGWYPYEQDYEYRHNMNGGSTKFTDSTTATFVVDMKLADGTTLSNVTVFFNNAGVRQAAYTCNGYSERSGFNGLDFRIAQGIVSFEVEVEKRDISVTKVWDDDNNSAGFRPSSVVVNLLADGAATGKSATLSASNNWTYTFADLNIKDSSGDVIAYTVAEVEPTNYDATVTGSATNGYTVTNTYVPETVTLSGIKVWDDGDNQDGIRPVDVTIELYANNVKVHEMDTSADKDWKWSFTVPKYQNGEEIEYTVKEEAVTGYTTAITGSIAAGYTITNTHVPEVVSISGKKTWDDEDNQDGIRPDSIYVSLYKDVVLNNTLDGTLVERVEISATNGWAYDFGTQPKYENGVEIYYYVVESEVAEGDLEHYSTEVRGYNITNHYTPETVTIAGNKIWWDGNDQDGIRPDSITIILKADGTEINSQEVKPKADGTWTYEFTTDKDGNTLPRYKNGGTAIVYTVEEKPVDDYTTEVDGYNIRNVHTPETVTISGEKKWEDANDQDGKRPDYIEITLMAKVGDSGTPYAVVEDRWVDSTEGWKYSFTNLPKYSNGEIITYYIEETEVTGYTTEIGAAVAGANGTINITNTHTPETINISGAKTWKDSNNQDGIRPESITITLWANNQYKAEKTVTSADNWSWTFNDQPKYADGKEIVYTITENAVAGYTSEVDGYNVTNTHEVAKTSIPVTKVWEDANNHNNKRPNEITVKLMADGVDSGKTLTLKAENNWSGTFDNLEVYKADAVGQKITYTVVEEAVKEGYSSTITGDAHNGYTITNTSVTDFSITKIWNHTYNDTTNSEAGITEAYGKFELHLFGDGVDLYEYYKNNPSTDHPAEKYRVTQAEVVKNGTTWTYTWTGLQDVRNGHVVTYTVWEVPIYDDAGVMTYVTSYGRDNDGNITVTNNYDPDHTEVAVSKVWQDNYDSADKRPEYIAVKLRYAERTIDSSERPTDSAWQDYPNGVAYLGATAGATVSVDGTNIELEYGSWQYYWNGLPQYKYEEATGTKIAEYVYDVVELGTDDLLEAGYNKSSNGAPVYKEDPSISNIKYIYNIYDTVNVTISGSKTWNDNDNQDGKRPASITINLLQNGIEIAEKTVKATDAWEWTFTEDSSGALLPRYDSNGAAYTYTITEDSVDGYTAVVDGYNVTNTHIPETTELKVTKVWDDSNDNDGKRPTEITVALVNASGQYVDKTGAETNTPVTLTLSASNNWTGTFTGLAVYKAGQALTYSVKELDNAKDGETEVSLSKLGYTPTVAKADNGVVVVTNTMTYEYITLSGTKVWIDESNQDGIRPSSVTIEVYADVDGDAYNPIKVREVHATAPSSVPDANTWTWSVSNLPKYWNGKLITYSINEKTVDGYNATYEVEAPSVDKTNTDYVAKVTNTHDPATIQIKGTKVWNDANNQDGKRPDSILIELWSEIPGSDDAPVHYTNKDATVTPDADGNWKFDFGTMPLYSGGKRIDYYVVEKGVNDTSSQAGGIASHDLDNYSTVITSTYTDSDNDGNPEVKDYTVTNIYTPETVIIAGTKEWHDNDNQDGIRPESITVHLLADGVEVNSMVIKEDDSGNWGGIFTTDKAGKALPRYRLEGIPIVYTLTEDPVEGYTTAIHGYNIVNTHIPETITITGEKTWDDEDNQDGIRPHNIEITLMGKVEGAQPYEVASEWISGEGDNWKWLFEDLPVYQNGKKVEYYIEEADITDYTPDIDELAVSADGKNGTINITNSHEPEVIDVSGEKTWDDNNDQDGKRPESITINLIANGEKVDSKTVSAKDGWKWTFEDVDKYADGKEIVYTVTEEAVEGYVPSYDGTDVTNTHTPETTFIVVSKVWEDDDNRDGVRPESITVTVKADGKAVGDPIVLNEDNSWHKVVADLPVYSEGEKIVYTVTENELDHYTGTVSVKDNVYTITNTHEIETTEITVKKLWKDNDDADGIRPESVKIQLLAGGEKVGEAVEVKDTYTWTDLPVNEDGEAIVYTVEEIDTPKGYEPKYSDLKAGVITITNVHEQETTDIKVTKTWVDNNDAKKARPKSITVQLYANGVEYGAAVTITADMKWEYTFEDLPANKNGEAIEYTVKEAGVKHYIAKYTVGNNNVLVIKNTYTDIPLTGDTINMLLWSIIGGSAMLTLGGVSVMAKRKKFVK